MDNFEKFGFSLADILIPAKDSDLSKWSAVACDQYTSEPEYWQRAYEFASGNPTSLEIILPEAFLDEGKLDNQVEKINSAMRKYLYEDLFDLYRDCFVYVERTLRDGRLRKGLVGAIDLERYEFEPNNSALIRATEGTVAERLPTRCRIRRNAPLEMPHIMLLVDDREDKIFKFLTSKKDALYKLYDFPLMENSGQLKGWLVKKEDSGDIFGTLKDICDIEYQKKLYGEGVSSSMLFAVGDGNHSLAAAKQSWEQIRENLSEDERSTHPARFALCELVNLHDGSLEFEAIHRVLFDCEPSKVLAAIRVYFPDSYEGRGEGQQFTFVSSEGEKTVTLPNPPAQLTVGSIQAFLDDYISAKGGKIDYIHGENVVRSLCESENACGFILPAMSKSELFPAVIFDGVLPRKTFSMGEACDKRFYLECRRLVK